MEFGSTPQQSESGDHADEPKAMVAVKMGDEHMAHLGEAHTASTQLHLHALATVDHEQFLTHLDHLCRRIMAKGGQRATTP
jgi:hypothetical protein